MSEGGHKENLVSLNVRMGGHITRELCASNVRMGFTKGSFCPSMSERGHQGVQGHTTSLSKCLYLLLEFVSTITMSFFSFMCTWPDCSPVSPAAASDDKSDGGSVTAGRHHVNK